MKFVILHRSSPPPVAENAQEVFPSLVWPQPQYSREWSEEPQMQCLSLVRRQKGNVISMKLILRNYEAE